MACGCRGKNGGYSYVYTSPTQQQYTYRTEIEARAAVIRNGGGSWAAVKK